MKANLQWKSLIVMFLPAIVRAISDCQVIVHEPWPVPHIFVPRESTMEIKCTAKEMDYTPFWLIDLANDIKDSSLQFTSGQKKQLNTHGVYELPDRPEMPSTLRLLINDTARNNQTIIQCDQGTTSTSTTTLFVLNPGVFQLAGDIGDMGVNLSWNYESQSLADDVLRFLLTISNGSSSQELSLSNESFYFTAPEGAPPCEIYNFSVTATYVGATYSGGGCSVFSPVLSTMLPSLPNISELESSLHHLLDKRSTSLSFRVYFEPASYCENFPIVNYTLVMNCSLNEEIIISMLASSVEMFTVHGNLSENAVYSFRIFVANNVGIVSTSDRQIYTTDVQVVTATLMEGVNTSTIQCEFIMGSTAAGCMVVLTSEKREETHYYNFTRIQNTTSTASNVTLEHLPSCYSGVEAFDIESDGSIGTVAVPGLVMNLSPSPCSPHGKSRFSDAVLLIWAIVVPVIFAVILLAIIIISILVCKSNKTQGGTDIVGLWKSRCSGICCFFTNIDHARKTATKLQFREQINIAYEHNKFTKEKSSPDQTGDNFGELSTSEGDNQSGEITSGVKGEDFYCDIASISQPGEETIDSGKIECVNSVHGSGKPPTERATQELAAREQEKTSISLKETLYDEPVAALERIPGDGADNPSSFSVPDQNKVHLYFTLEPDGLSFGDIPSPISPQTHIPDAQVSSQPPATSVSPPAIYQEITELSTYTDRELSAGRAITTNGGSFPNTPLSSSSLPQIQMNVSVSITDNT